MLVIALGVQASGSTWLFNAVRMLLAHASVRAASLVEDDGLSVLDNVPLSTDHVVVKAHGLDLRGLTLASLSHARLIVSTRDPRDCVVSQQQRFQDELRNVVKGLSRSLASIAMLPAQTPRLDFRYEDRFFETPATIEEIARFLGLPVDAAVAAAIFQTLRPESVKGSIAKWLGSLRGEPPRADPVTQWHPRHLGDGRIGKWRHRLSAAQQALVTDCLCPLTPGGGWRSSLIRWSDELFFHAEGVATGHAGDIELDGLGRTLVYGPYLHLPAGRWRARPCVEAAPARRPARVRIDVHLPNTGRGVVAEQIHSPGPGAGGPAAMEFDLHDHFQPVELRLGSIEGAAGWVCFHGAELQWLGPVRVGAPTSASLIGREIAVAHGAAPASGPRRPLAARDGC